MLDNLDPKAPLVLDLLVDDRWINSLNTKPITSMNIFDQKSNFASDGLYSIDIFGKVGSTQRMEMFGHIPLNIPIIHPKIFKHLTKLKDLYLQTFSSKSYVVINEDKTDMIKSNLVNGNTGYQYMLENVFDLDFETRGSPEREHTKKLINKYKGDAVFSKLLVLPAGIREYEVKDSGQASEDEINKLYRKVIAKAALIDKTTVKTDVQSYDKIRFELQLAINEIYDYIMEVFNGKRGLLDGKFARRNTFNTTRNVFTSAVVPMEHADDPDNPDVNDTLISLPQMLVNLLPIIPYHLKNKILSPIFSDSSTPARLINPKDYSTELVSLKNTTYDLWLTQVGVGKLVEMIKNKDLRSQPVMVEDHHLLLIYKEDSPKKTYRLVYDLNTIPDDIDKNKIKPITYAELFYLAVADVYRQYPMLVTRYPAIEEGSDYPSRTYLVTTLPFETRTELDPNFELTDHELPQFPIDGGSFYEAMSPNQNHLGTMGADFDGDTGNSQQPLTKESIEEINNILDDVNYYVNSNGKLTYSNETDVSKLTITYMKG